MIPGFCHLSIIPLRAEPSSKSEMVSQLLFGENYHVLDTHSGFSLIRSLHDQYEGFISSVQLNPVNTKHWSFGPVRPINEALAIYGEGADQRTIVRGSLVPDPDKIWKAPMNGLRWVDLARSYLNSPYLWGGRHPLGIDCSGLTQITGRLAGVTLLRDAWQQAGSGQTVEFLDMAQPGDLAFFDNEEGKIIHTGILTGQGTIIHAHGWVREDLIDPAGILIQGKYSHRLRIVKRYI